VHGHQEQGIEVFPGRELPRALEYLLKAELGLFEGGVPLAEGAELAPPGAGRNLDADLPQEYPVIPEPR